jgi:hypothetical protein
MTILAGPGARPNQTVPSVASTPFAAARAHDLPPGAICILRSISAV